MANRSFNIGLANVRGLLAGAKLALVSSLLEKESLDVLCITETHLGPHDTVSLDDAAHAFVVHRADRAQNRGNRHFGGVAIVSRARLGAVELQLPQLQFGTEAIAIELALPRGGKMCVVAVYHPNGQVVMDLGLIRHLEAAYDRLVVCGDFNAKHPNWGVNATANPNGVALRDFLSNHTLLQLVECDEATWVAPGLNSNARSTLDLFLVSPREAGGAALRVLGDIGSDHVTLCLSLDVQCVQDRAPPPVARFCFQRAKWQEYSDQVEQLLAGRQANAMVFANPDDLDRGVAFVEGSILDAANLHIPKRQSRPERPPELPRYITRLQRQRSDLMRRISNGEFWLKPERNRLTREISGLVQAHRARTWRQLCNGIEERDPSRKFTKILQKAQGCPVEKPLKVNGQSLRTSEEKSEAFADSLAQSFRPQRSPLFDARRMRVIDALITMNRAQFARAMTPRNEADDQHILAQPITVDEVVRALRTAPNRCPGTDGIYNIMLRRAPISLLLFLARLYSGCLLLGCMPNAWKRAEAVMIPKPGKDHTEPGNYRPISLLSVLAKLLEKIIATRMSRYFEDQGVFNKVQCGFRNARSTQDHLLRLAQAVSFAFNRRESVVCVSLDVAKAFDTVWHNGLRYKLCERRLGLPRKLIRFLSDYLSDRFFRVRCGGARSGWRPVGAGVPQGGSLSPLLYLTFVRDMPLDVPDDLERFIGTSQFADDIALWSTSRDPQLAIRRLQPFLDGIADWCNRWRVVLNVGKTQCVMFSRRRAPLAGLAPPTLYGQPLAYTAALRFLGILFDPKLTFTPYIEELCRRCKFRLAVLASVCGWGYGPPLPTAFRLYKMYIRPLIEYGSAAWSQQIGVGNRVRLERIQNWGCRIALRFPQWAPREQLRRLTRTQTVEERLLELGVKYLRKARRDNSLIRELAQVVQGFGPAQNGWTPTPVEALLR